MYGTDSIDEGRCFVLSCNQFNRRRDFPADYRSSYGNDPETVITRGGSCIVDPFGNLLAGPNTEGEAILMAELNPAQIAKGIAPEQVAAAIVKAAGRPHPRLRYVVPAGARPLIALLTSLPGRLADRAKQRALAAA